MVFPSSGVFSLIIYEEWAVVKGILGNQTNTTSVFLNETHWVALVGLIEELRVQVGRKVVPNSEEPEQFDFIISGLIPLEL